ncbi:MULTISPECIES: CD225/dispanin family protein [unclassified Alistipes]|uniref:CD225/dispanin family protein n=1 Tax=unclassified Alistipes TaxID=2608932 RepID=UPI00258BBFD7|nr:MULTISPECIES: CD225/dispanin family protein [unclassified Alistipes]MCX4282746.1 CD225/dispanin family protein [Alistipes sp.]HUN14813.1 CD225/dispanin family protein [Alistipes sp.]
METNMQKPDNNLVWAILATVLCCLPFGIVAIIKSTQVDSFWAAGRYDEAVQAAADARKWCWVSVIVSVVVVVLYFLLIAGVAGLAVVGSQL